MLGNGFAAVQIFAEFFRQTLLIQRESGQFERLFQPDATGTERADIALEERFGWRVVQIDVERIGKHEFDPAQRVVLAGVLAQKIRKSPFQVAPIDGVRVDGFGVAVIAGINLETAMREERRVALLLRQ